jgi:tRNA threonylcarbamoyladenosine biosynthesis protein TsaE
MSRKQTMNFGKQLAYKLKGGDVVLLKGDLGAGKTTLVKGIALGLGIKNEITSPTFALMNVYEVKSQKSIKSKVIKFVHIDTYRLANEKELIEIGVEDYLGDKNCVCVIEWPEKLTTLLKNKKTISVDIESVGENKRKILMNS